MALTRYELASTTFNFTGSLLSFLGSAFILLCYLIIPMKRHIRHFLILNLAISDFFNALNNTVSGMAVLINMRLLRMSVPCVVNGFIAQFTVLATDFNILAIAVITLVAIRSSTWRTLSDRMKRQYTLYVCAAVWVIPLITALVALKKNLLGPVSGNWCWIKAEPVYVRYVLTHAWRLTFIAIEVVIYAYMYRYLKNGIFPDSSEGKIPTAPAAASLVSRHSTAPPIIPLIPVRSDDDHEYPIGNEKQAPGVVEMKRVSISGEKVDTQIFPTKSATRPSTELPFNPSASELSSTTRPCAENCRSNAWTETSSDPDTPMLNSKAVSRIMLLNAYPLAYIILWIPGVANRIAEATGHPNRVLRMMQATTQFVGFANALTYGWNEKVADSLKEWWNSRA